MLFIFNGSIGVGYEINKQVSYAKKLGKKSVIGDYYIMFSKRSEFVYKALSIIDCYAFRKRHLS